MFISFFRSVKPLQFWLKSRKPSAIPLFWDTTCARTGAGRGAGPGPGAGPGLGSIPALSNRLRTTVRATILMTRRHSLLILQQKESQSLTEKIRTFDDLSVVVFLTRRVSWPNFFSSKTKKRTKKPPLAIAALSTCFIDDLGTFTDTIDPKTRANRQNTSKKRIFKNGALRNACDRDRDRSAPPMF